MEKRRRSGANGYYLVLKKLFSEKKIQNFLNGMTSRNSFSKTQGMDFLEVLSNVGRDG